VTLKIIKKPSIQISVIYFSKTISEVSVNILCH